MRRVPQNRPLTTALIDHRQALEFEEISCILDTHPVLVQMVQADIVQRGIDPGNGRPGMTAEQTLRCLLLKQTTGFSYEDLEFHLADSATYRRFCRIGAFDKSPKRSCLQKNIKRVRAETAEQINRVIIHFAQAEGIETGRLTRVDCTVVETDIHEPGDSWQLWDSVRVLARLMGTARDKFGFVFCDHSRVAKHLAYGIRTAKDAKRKKLYRKLIHWTQVTVEDAARAIAALSHLRPDVDPLDAILAEGLRQDLLHYAPLAKQVIHQTDRRVFHGENLPPEQKVVSIFEPHTDIIIKSRRKTEFGHKIIVATGPSGLITDCIVLDGNPADSTLAVEMIERHTVIFGHAPNQAAFDGGFAAKANIPPIKALGTRDVAFSKRRGIPVEDMTRSEAVYRRLFRFRAGIEAGISLLKRCFGLTRCLWQGLNSFKAYVWSAALSCNLLVLARLRLALADP